MSYFVMDEDSGASDDFAFFDGEPKGLERSDWWTGRPISGTKDMLITKSKKDKVPISDLVLSASDIPIYSPRLRALLSETGATNIQYVPVILVDKPNKTKTRDYQIANILGLVDCVDLKKSYVERSAKSGRIMSLEAFHLIEKKVLPLTGMKSAPVIFRLADYPSIVIAHESVKLACEKAKMTGIKFVATAKYH